MKRFQFLGRRPESRLKSQRKPRRAPAHDPMLVFNMTVFNFAKGSHRSLNLAR